MSEKKENEEEEMRRDPRDPTNLVTASCERLRLDKANRPRCDLMQLTRVLELDATPSSVLLNEAFELAELDRAIAVRVDRQEERREHLVRHALNRDLRVADGVHELPPLERGVLVVPEKRKEVRERHASGEVPPPRVRRGAQLARDDAEVERANRQRVRFELRRHFPDRDVHEVRMVPHDSKLLPADAVVVVPIEEREDAALLFRRQEDTRDRLETLHDVSARQRTGAIFVCVRANQYARKKNASESSASKTNEEWWVAVRRRL